MAGYRYSISDTEIIKGDFVTVTTGSVKDGTLSRRNGFVTEFTTSAPEGQNGHRLYQVSVTLPDGEVVLAAPSRLLLISR